MSSLSESLSKEAQGDPSHNQQYQEIIWKALKGIIITSLLIFLTINTVYGFGLPHNNITNLYDGILEATTLLNTFLSNHLHIRNTVLIISSLMIDLLFLFSALCWIAYSKTMRVLVILVVFYSFRAFVQAVFQLGFPIGYLWDYPGFPSLIVGYLKTNDFFFSGHVGFPIILAIEWKRNGVRMMEMICFGVCLMECFTMIAMRGHYSIDLISGVVFAHYCYVIVEPYVEYVDMLKEIICSCKNDHEVDIERESNGKIKTLIEEDLHTNDNSNDDIDEQTPMIV